MQTYAYRIITTKCPYYVHYHKSRHSFYFRQHRISPAIVVDYSQQYFDQSTVSCICNKCTEGSAHSSSSHNSNNSKSEYISS
jgi:hypothetical protein